MKAALCNAGHYYDADKFSSCPYCSDTEGKTVSYEEHANEEPTVAFPANPEKSYAAEPVAATPVVGWLVCVEGAERGRDFRLQAGRNFIGRALDMDVCIREDAAVSRENHCSAIYDPRSGRFALLPGNSTETKVNGEVLEGVHDLKDGDLIKCGETVLCFIGFCAEGRKW